MKLLERGGVPFESFSHASSAYGRIELQLGVRTLTAAETPFSVFGALPALLDQGHPFAVGFEQMKPGALVTWPAAKIGRNPSQSSCFWRSATTHRLGRFPFSRTVPSATRAERAARRASPER